MNAFKVKNERKLLVKNKNTAYSFRRFSAFPLYCWARAARLMARKNRLNTKCAFHDMFLSTPPQEQGTRCQYPASTNPMYPVNTAIRIVDKNSPALCHLSVSNRAMATSSAEGTKNTSAPATSGGKFWLYISCQNKVTSASLLMAAYAKSRISRAGAAVLNMVFIAVGLWKQRTAGWQQQNSMK